jgi:hypothetical protein
MGCQLGDRECDEEHPASEKRDVRRERERQKEETERADRQARVTCIHSTTIKAKRMVHHPLHPQNIASGTPRKERAKQSVSKVRLMIRAKIPSRDK